MRALLCAKFAGASLPLRPNETPIFLADAMLGSVARKLRVFGFDTVYLVHTDDNEILRVGESERRIILTADRQLFKRIIGSGGSGVLVDCSSEIKDIVHILSKSGIKSLEFGTSGDEAIFMGSRCSSCNGPLVSASRSDVQGQVPGAILASHKDFLQCYKCGKVYWKGSHFRRLQLLAKRVNAQLVLQEKTAKPGLQKANKP